jgi:hypothetical protein
MRKHPRKGNIMVVMREVPVQSRGAVALVVKLGNNARTCLETAESSASSTSDVIVVDY